MKYWQLRQKPEIKPNAILLIPVVRFSKAAKPNTSITTTCGITT
jgi:hypothetical protein